MAEPLWARLIDAGIALLLGEADADPPPKPRKKRSTSERTIHRVRQLSDTSCGVAATAMLARVSHETAQAMIFPGGPRTSYGTHYADIRRALDHFKVPHGNKAVRTGSWSKIPTTALVKVRWSVEGHSGLHWIIFQRKSASAWRLIDPGAKSPETQLLKPADYAHYHPLSYLTVSPVVPQGAPRAASTAKTSVPKQRARATKEPGKSKPSDRKQNAAIKKRSAAKQRAPGRKTS